MTGHGDVIVRQGYPGPLMPSPFTFKKYGQSGVEVSELFPNLAKKVDEIAFIRSMFGRSNDHTQAHYEMQSGQIRAGYPSMGSWVTYGLGSESSGLPGFVVLHDYRGGPIGGPQVWTSGFLPAAYQGTPFRATGDPIVDLKPPMTPEQQRARLDTLAKDRRIRAGGDLPGCFSEQCLGNDGGRRRAVANLVENAPHGVTQQHTARVSVQR